MGPLAMAAQQRQRRLTLWTLLAVLALGLLFLYLVPPTT